ncbi:LysM domain-containing protein [Cladobotryum mycophilum]|uniref:LysM domain-containing protein n=1 Tax=Cladobotryum mycophilum TaxID=491253 RepID=A0ABR0SWE4_9HYPO
MSRCEAKVPLRSFHYQVSHFLTYCRRSSYKAGVYSQHKTFYNPEIAESCDNYIIGRSCCMEPSRERTPKPNNDIETSSPAQPDTVDTCKKFHYVEEGQSCDRIIDDNGITVKDFVSWNHNNYDFETGNMAGWKVSDGTYSANSRALAASGSQGGKAIVNARMDDFIMQSDITLPSPSDNVCILSRMSNADRIADAYRGYYGRRHQRRE